MAGYRVDISGPAENDLRDIVRYIAAQLTSPVTALNMMDAIEDAALKLSRMPKSYPPVLDDRLLSMGYRKSIVNNHVIFFTIDEKEKTVNVERILYMRRDWRHIL